MGRVQRYRAPSLPGVLLIVRVTNDVDLIVRGGTIYDGSGRPPQVGDVAIEGDRIAAVGDVGRVAAHHVIDADGLAVAPGFINMMSWSNESLIEDGASQSDIRQGVTLEVMGEGWSMGPLTDEMKAEVERRGAGNPLVNYAVEWTTLGQYLGWLERRGISPNVASFVGASTVRIHAMGHEARPATEEELGRMRELVREAMAEGALGVASALIYPPATSSTTHELVALASVAAEFGGLYASHIRSEGAALIEAVEELLEIARLANVRAEIYHLKTSGRTNWPKMDGAIEMIEAARATGRAVTADAYPYTFSGTGLDACIPPWAHEGGFDKLVTRLRDPETRARILEGMRSSSSSWENPFLETTPDAIVVAGFRQDALRHLTGMTLAQVSSLRGRTPEETVLDLLVEDDNNVDALYFAMSEDDVRKVLSLPWVSFCSDAESLAPEGIFLKANPHPRAYGAFARVLGTYVRDERILPLEEAIRRMTSLPAENLRLEGRGRLREGAYADVVVFDPLEVRDHATPDDPHRYSTGVRHVLVNGTPVISEGEHTGARPGRFVRGPGVSAS
jgi:N-acyl-D-amino-acid deacylase